MLPLAMSCGDPGGVGLEIAIAAWAGRKAGSLPSFYLLADPDVVAARAARIGIDVPIRVADPDDAPGLFAEALPVVALETRMTDRPGVADPANAPAIIEAIERAVEDCFARRAGGIVTLPIAKTVLHSAGFGFPGHTEFLAHLAEKRIGTPFRSVMMMAGPLLRTVPVTVHVALAEVAGMLSPALIVDTCRIVARDLETRFGIARPRLAVAGLNPHAGEQGAFGMEEQTILAPALAQLRAEGLDVAGPLPADTLFHAAARQTYDAAICMYHDQALIPVKCLDFERTVNVTLGLPFIRTSPDHGTAFGIAGSGTANPESTVEAIRLAGRLSGGAGE